MVNRLIKFGDQDNDSESPSDAEDMSYQQLRPMGGESPDSNFEESEYDPRLEQKIEQIKKNIKAGSNSNSQANTNTQPGAITSNDSGIDRDNQKLEEVLKRQRDRLDYI